MGYTSNVVIYIEENENVLNKLGIKSLEELKDVMENAWVNHFEIGINRAGNRVLRCEWYGTKWYDGYEAVDAVMNTLNKLDEDVDYTFARLGEEFGDFDSKGYLGEIYPIAEFDEDWMDYYNKEGLRPQYFKIDCGNINADMTVTCKEHLSILKEFHKDKTVITLTNNHDHHAKAIQNIQRIEAYNTVNNITKDTFNLDRILDKINKVSRVKDEINNIEYRVDRVELDEYKLKKEMK